MSKLNEGLSALQAEVASVLSKAQQAEERIHTARSAISSLLTSYRGNGEADQALADIYTEKTQMLDIERKKSELTQARKTLQAQMAQREVLLRMDIAEATGDDGKKLYGNEQARKDALTLALTADKETTAMAADLDTMNQALLSAEFDLQKHETNLSVKWAFLRLTEARLRALASLLI